MVIWVGELIAVMVLPLGMPMPLITCPTESPVVLATLITFDPISTLPELICVVPPLVRLKVGTVVFDSMAHQMVAA